MAEIFLRDLAHELGVDRSALRKFVLKAEIPMIRRRTNSNGHHALVLSESDAQRVRDLRVTPESLAVIPSLLSTDGRPFRSDEGFLYVIQVVPDLEPNRVKLGFANNVEWRLAEHRTSAPTAELLYAWACRRTWEQAAIASATQGCRCIRNEVFEADELEKLHHRLQAFFAVMPPVAVTVQTP